MSLLVRCAVAAVAATLAACSNNNTTSVPPEKVFIDAAIPGVGASTNFSFDLGTVVNGKYYFTDRNNKSVDVIDLGTFAVTVITGSGANAFTGCKPNASCAGANNGLSGPDGINAIPGTTQLYVGDVDFVRIIDTSTNTVVKSIRVGTSGFRADEGCFDRDHNIYMISSPDAPVPFASFISTTTQAVLATVLWTDPAGGSGAVAGGNEQCQYDTTTQSFIVNNDATVANPHGEVDVIPVSSITALAAGATTTAFSLPGVKRFGLGNCDPTGLDLGPGRDIIVECRPGDAGSPLTTLILDRVSGNVLATIPVGGGDQVAFDARTNRYFVAAARWHASGKNDAGGGCAASNPCTPVLAVINALTRTIAAIVPTGNNAHSVAVDPASGLVFLPYSAATVPAGCSTCAANGFLTGGVSIFDIP
jgi:YVTN family beta-propeller protein